jgi:hypothetical protein
VAQLTLSMFIAPDTRHLLEEGAPLTVLKEKNDA